MADILIDNQSLPTTPAAGKSLLYVDAVSKKMHQLDDGGIARGVLSRNFTTASQGAGFAVDTYVTNSNIIVPSGGLQAGMMFEWTLSLSKTAAGTAATILTFRLGTGLATSDTSLLALTSSVAQTAAIAEGLMKVMLAIRTGGASGVCAGGFGLAAAVGLGGGKDGVSGSVDLSAASGKSMGLSINGGASAAWTLTSCVGHLLS